MYTTENRYPIINTPNETWNSLKRQLLECHESIKALLDQLHCTYEQAGMIDTIDDKTHIKLCDDLESLFSFAETLTSQMSALSNGNPVQKAQFHRYEVVTQEYKSQSQFMLKKISEKKLRERLLEPKTLKKDANNRNFMERDALLTENNNIRSSLKSLEDTTSQAATIMKSMTRQGVQLKNASASILNFNQTGITLKKTMKSITTLQLRHRIILATVTGLCLLFLLMYLFR
jgi:Fe2+ transport system protein B